MLIIDGHICDWDMAFLGTVLKLLDSRLEELDAVAATTSDPESHGVCDHYEEVCGVGFVACQRYLAAACGWLKIEKHVALTKGPRVPSGLTIAQAVNHAANYWKHHDEWSGEETERELKTKRAIEGFGGTIGHDYPLSCVLAETTNRTCRLTDLIPRLEEWRNEIRNGA